MAEADEARYLTDITWNYWRDKGIKPRITWIELKHVADFFIKECKKRGIDPQTVDFRDLIAEAGLSYEEHIDKVKEVLDSIVAAPPEPTVVGLSEALAKLEDLGIRLKEEELKKIEDVQKFEEAIERLKRNLERTKREVEEEKRRREEAERKLEEEKRKAKTIRIRFVKDHLPWYRKDAVIETDDFEWAMGLVNKGIAERVTPEVPLHMPPLHMPPKPKELTKDEIAKLEDLFKATLFRELGGIPRDAMSEFRVELETVKMLPYEEASKVIERLAKDIVVRARARSPARPSARPPARPPPVEAAVPEEMLVYPVELPRHPLSPLPFPRGVTSEEEEVFWNHFRYEMARLGKDVLEYRDRFYERIKLPHRSWSDLLKTYMELIADIEAGRPVSVIPIVHRVTMPWREDTEENWRFDAIAHLASTGLYETMDDLIHSTSPPGLEAYGVMGVTPEEVKKVIKKAWQEKSHWFIAVPKERLEKIIGEKL